jgi:hypothetical protein
MAKAEVICPFSGELCKECPLYRGRHYYLCFCEKYRGYLSKSGEAPAAVRVGPNGKFEMPAIRLKSSLDPFITTLNENEKED